jgi:hypothetical protein
VIYDPTTKLGYDPSIAAGTVAYFNDFSSLDII